MKPCIFALSNIKIKEYENRHCIIQKQTLHSVVAKSSNADAYVNGNHYIVGYRFYH